ncbi:MAG TPA: ABC transporter transmembrane domain-containing protein, partial [Caulobacteraceae bacterium]
MSDPQLEPNAPGRPGTGALLVEQMDEARGKRAKSKNLRPLARLLPYVGRHRADAALAGLFLLLASAATLSISGAARLLIDHGFQAGGSAAAIDRWFLLLGAVAVVLGLSSAARYFYVTKVGERVVADLRQDLYRRIMTLDPSYFIRMRTGEVLSRLTTDIQIIETLLSTSVSVALRNSLTLVGSLVLLFVVSPKLTLLVLAVFPFVLAPMFLFARLVRKLTVKTQDEFAAAVGYAGESLDALETVQAFSREQSAIGRFHEAVERAFAVSVGRMRARGLMIAFMISVMFGGVALVFWLGSRDVVSGVMSAGTLVQFVLLAVLAAGSVGVLGEVWG